MLGLTIHCIWQLHWNGLSAIRKVGLAGEEVSVKTRRVWSAQRRPPIHLGLGGQRSEPLLKGITGMGRVSGLIHGGACALCAVLRLLAELMGGGASMGALVRPNTD